MAKGMPGFSKTLMHQDLGPSLQKKIARLGLKIKANNFMYQNFYSLLASGSASSP
jgi:hypothetical protein